MERHLTPSFTPGRKWRIGFNVFISTLLMIAVAAMLNYLSNRFYYRWTAGDPPLSPTTKHVLAALTNDVKVIVFYDRREDLFNSVSTLLQQYKLASPRIKVEFVDYRFPGRAEQIQEAYKFTDQSDGNRIIFDVQNRVKVVHEKELSIYDTDAMFQGQPVRRTAFRGEQLFSSAIFSVTSADQPTAYFLSGHGEHDPEDPRDGAYSQFSDMLKETNVKLAQMDSLLQFDIPADCDLLIIPGPRNSFQPVELDRINRYLAASGRIFLLYNVNSSNPQRQLNPLLAQYGIQVGEGIVTDVEGSQEGDEGVLVIDKFGPHPIVAPLNKSSVALVHPKPVSAREGKPSSADAANAVNLLLTSKNGSVTVRGDKKTGSISVAAAAEKGGIAGVNSIRGSTRLVVAGDSVFLSNGALNYEGNFDFANLAVNWLLSRELLLGDIAPRAIEEFRLTLTKGQMKQFKLLFLAVAPGTVLLIGAMVWFRRRF